MRVPLLTEDEIAECLARVPGWGYNHDGKNTE